jgi:hypothetical protein
MEVISEGYLIEDTSKKRLRWMWHVACTGETKLYMEL